LLWLPSAYNRKIKLGEFEKTESFLRENNFTIYSLLAIGFKRSLGFRVVNQSLKIDFVAEPVQSCRPGAVLLGDWESEICDQEIAALLEKNALKFSSKPHQTSFLSSFFAIPKKDGKFRPVHNLKMLNRFVVYCHFKM
jgi:hypothetical protein